ncbi:helix-turn-helix transcriptional regulator [Candidatus Gracilibacteria bacterium]|nr:helix-turn-helix transcriptional regulator [Candidatus Gracilibacteria bacterium]NJM90397.1 helix-turn-helix transcriptional regulator [Hydrococcus sp. RU_2_2]
MKKVSVSRIAELRQKAGLTQKELALKVGVTETTIRNYEKGRSILEWIERVIRLCDALNCAPLELKGYVNLEEIVRSSK